MILEAGEDVWFFAAIKRSHILSSCDIVLDVIPSQSAMTYKDFCALCFALLTKVEARRNIGTMISPRSCISVQFEQTDKQVVALLDQLHRAA